MHEVVDGSAPCSCLVHVQTVIGSSVVLLLSVLSSVFCSVLLWSAVVSSSVSSAGLVCRARVADCRRGRHTWSESATLCSRRLTVVRVSKSVSDSRVQLCVSRSNDVRKSRAATEGGGEADVRDEKLIADISARYR